MAMGAELMADDRDEWLRELLGPHTVEIPSEENRGRMGGIEGGVDMILLEGEGIQVGESGKIV